MSFNFALAILFMFTLMLNMILDFLSSEQGVTTVGGLVERAILGIGDTLGDGDGSSHLPQVAKHVSQALPILP